ncbi:MAG: hypothetical protein ABFD50_00225 [Smithella sp.]
MAKGTKFIFKKNEYPSVSMMAALGDRCQTISINATSKTAKKIVF